MSYYDVDIISLYASGLSAQQIKDKYKIPTTVRSIQRFLAKHSATRPRKVAYDMAVKEGRLGAHKKQSSIKRMKLPPMLRYMLFKRDNFRCQICGATAKDRLLEIDHIDFDVRNNDPKNLQVLCEWCNKGRRKNIV
jgi:5-methylcytosine-specific restriction endonuclease McrA